MNRYSIAPRGPAKCHQVSFQYISLCYFSDRLLFVAVVRKRECLSLIMFMFVFCMIVDFMSSFVVSEAEVVAGDHRSCYIEYSTHH